MYLGSSECVYDAEEEKKRCGKAAENLKNVGKDEIPCLLVITGTFSPIHRMHIASLELAKDKIESSKILENNMKYHVIGGFISPTHDEYCSYKLDHLAINKKDRNTMIDLAIKDHKWIELDAWHTNQKRMVSIDSEVWHTEYMCKKYVFNNVFNNVAKLEEKENKVDNSNDDKKEEMKFKVFFVCGTDLAQKNSSLYRYGFDNYGVCIIDRSGYKTIDEKMVNSTQKSPVILISEKEFNQKCSKIKDASSTSIRQRIDQGKMFDDITFENVQSYMIKNDILGAKSLQTLDSNEKKVNETD